MLWGGRWEGGSCLITHVRIKDFKIKKIKKLKKRKKNNKNLIKCIYGKDFPGNSAGKESACNAGDPSLTPGSRRSSGEGIGYLLLYSWAYLVAQMVKNPPAMQET